MQSIIATVALLAASALADSIGQAVVVNKCNYNVLMHNTPAADGGYTEIDKTLSPNDSYTMQWTQLSNGDGWSIKLGKEDCDWQTNLMQYEYTFHGDGIIWYDLSDVNGNPWDGDWEITASSASSTCTPKQQAYRYATDDAYGMQACPQDSVITVTLCSGEDQDDSGAASASSSVAAATSAASTSFAAPSSTPAQVSSYAQSASSVEASSTQYSSASPTTFLTSSVVTSAVTSTNAGGSTVTDVDTAVVTNVVTATQYRQHGHQWTRRHGHNHA